MLDEILSRSPAFSLVYYCFLFIFVIELSTIKQLKNMSILLQTEPTETLLGILCWGLIIFGIIILVKFFQIAKDVRSIKCTLDEIAKSSDKKNKL